MPVADVIPVYAGSSGCRASPWLRPRVHPRTRGEQVRACFCFDGVSGPSPHARGAVVAEAPPHVLTRSIPTRAGSSFPICDSLPPGPLFASLPKSATKVPYRPPLPPSEPIDQPDRPHQRHHPRRHQGPRPHPSTRPFAHRVRPSPLLRLPVLPLLPCSGDGERAKSGEAGTRWGPVYTHIRMCTPGPNHKSRVSEDRISEPPRPPPRPHPRPRPRPHPLPPKPRKPSGTTAPARPAPRRSARRPSTAVPVRRATPA